MLVGIRDAPDAGWVLLHADLARNRGDGRPRSKWSGLPAVVEEDAVVPSAARDFEIVSMESLQVLPS